MFEDNEITVNKIFYADDDSDDLEIFINAAKEIGGKDLKTIDIHVYSIGMELLKALKSLKPKDAVIFLDINMPAQNGFDILKEIRKNEDLKLLPVVMYSTTSDSRAIDTSYDLGANAYAIKPYSIAEISGLIRKVIGVKWHQTSHDRMNFLIN